MSLNQYVENLEEAGIADTRTYSLNHGMEVLWGAYVMLDLSGRKAFNEFVGDRTVREALIQWAKTQPGNNSRL